MDTCLKNKSLLEPHDPITSEDSDDSEDFFDEIIEDLSEFISDEENNNIFRRFMFKIRSLLYSLGPCIPIRII